MDGLEAVEIKYSDLQKLKTMRIDNEYFSKCYIENEALLQKFGYRSIGKIVGTITDFGAYSQTNFIELQEQGVNFFRNQDVKNNTIDNSGCAKISNEVYNKLTLKLQPNDILIPRTGTLGNACVISENHLPASANQNLAVLRDIQTMLPHYVAVVLCSKVGLLQINRNSTGNVQQWLNLDAIKGIKIPTATENFQKEIQAIIKNSEKLLDESKNIYNCAEQLLTDYLKVHSQKETWKNSSVKMLGDSFNITGRLDAEYYHPKYEQYEKTVKESKIGFTLIKDKFEPITERCDRTLSQYQYIEIGDINVGTGIATPNVVLTEELPANAKIMTKANDILVSTVRPNRGAVSILTQDDLLVSGAFTVLRESSDYPKEVLQVLLRLEMYRDWLLRYNVGTSYPVIKDADVLNLPIPIFDSETTESVVENIRKSYDLRECSKHLLNIAVKTVEMAIESDEEFALLWLESQK